MAEPPAPPPAPLARDDGPTTLATSAGDVPLHAYQVRLGGRTWSILHTGAVLTPADEEHFLNELRVYLPYGVALWPSAIALAHELVARAGELAGRRVLEVGAGTGLPGIVAASLGAHVVQTDRHEGALEICRRNGARNGVAGIEYRLADWTDWLVTERFDWIIGADVLYGAAMQPHLRAVLEGNLVPGGRVLLADPMRAVSLRLLEALEDGGWRIAFGTWTVGEAGAERPIGVFELTRDA